MKNKSNYRRALVLYGHLILLVSFGLESPNVLYWDELPRYFPYAHSLFVFNNISYSV